MFTGLEGEQVPWGRERTGRRGEDGQEGRGWKGWVMEGLGKLVEFG